MLKNIAVLKHAARSYKPVPNEFSDLATSSTPLQKLNRIYASQELRSQLHHKSVQLLVFNTEPAAPPYLLQYSPQSTIPIAIRSYLFAKDLNLAFEALKYLNSPPSKNNYYLSLLALGLASGYIWNGPVGVLLGIFWSGLGIVPKTPEQFRYVKWRSHVPYSQRNKQVIALCDHIVAWYEDHVGITTENWHRQTEKEHVPETLLARLLAEKGLERAPRSVDYEYADYWAHRDDFSWQEPDQDPAYFDRNVKK